MSSIKSKESDRPINKHAEHNYNSGDTGAGPGAANCYRGIYGNGPTTGSSQTCPAR